MTINLNINEPFNGFLSILSSNSGITGESPMVSLQRKSDGYYWDNSTLTWILAVTTNSMTEYDSTNEPGLYRYYSGNDLTTTEDTVVVHYKNTGTYAADSYDILYVRKDFAANWSTGLGVAGYPLVSTPSGSTTVPMDMLSYIYAALRNETTASDSSVTIADSDGNVISEADITKSASLVTRAKFANP